MNRRELLDALAVVKQCIPTTSNIRLLTCFCFDGDSVTGYNGMQTASFKLQTNLSCAVHADSFYRLINSYTTEEIDLYQNKDGVFIKSGKSKASFPFFDTEAFLFKEFDKNQLGVSIEVSDEFLAGLKKCLSSVNKDQLIPNQYGITLDVGYEELHMYSTDNTRVSHFTMNTSCDEKVKVLLPEAFCELLLNFGKSTLFFADHFVAAMSDRGYVMSAIQAGIKWLNYEGRLEVYKVPDTDWIDTPSELLDIIKRCKAVGMKSVNLFGNTGENVLNIVATNGDISITENIDFMVNTDFASTFPLKELEESLKLSNQIYLFAQYPAVLVGKIDDYMSLLGSR